MSLTASAEDMSGTLAFVITKEPDWSALPANTPAAMRTLLRRCLQKDPKRRLQAIGDAWLEIEDAASVSDVAGSVSTADALAKAVSPASRARTLLPWIAAVSAIGVAIALGALIVRHREPADLGLVRFAVAPDEGTTLGSNIGQRGNGPAAAHYALSPDGRRLAYVAYKSDAKPQLWIRRMGALAGQPMPGTDEASYPFWSPDSRFIAFFAQGKLKKIDASGGPPQTICDGPAGEGGTWNRDGDIVFAPADAGGLSRVAAAGGVPTPTSTLDAAAQETSHHWPQFLPDGRHFLYLAMIGVQRVHPRSSGSTAPASRWKRSERLAPIRPSGCHRTVRPRSRTCRRGQGVEASRRAISGSNPTISPDGRWMAYQSDKSGTSEIYGRAFPSGDREWRISQSGGAYPRWRGDGRELFYVGATPRSVMAVGFKGTATLDPSAPVKLFDAPFLVRSNGTGQIAVSADGQRFLVIEPQPAQDTHASALTIVLNWTDALRK